MPSTKSIHRLLPLTTLCALLAAGAAFSQQNPAAGSSALRLSADHGELDNTKGVSIYRGNVEVTRGALRITGDVLRVYRGDDNGLDRIEVEGSPATYHDKPKGAANTVDAQASTMIYHASGPERVDLKGKAVLERGRDTVRGKQVHYDIGADRIEADSGKQQRVEITLYPNKGNTGNEAP